jgi:hypothetical protein
MLCILGWPQQPRHVVDLEHLVFIIGHQYYCGHKECKKSWLPAILQAIPPPLAALFPFHLTYQCGLTDRLVGVLWASFQRGIGPSPFAKNIQMMHICYYEQLYVQYLETVRQRMQASASGLLPPHQPFPHWNDPSDMLDMFPLTDSFDVFITHSLNDMPWRWTNIWPCSLLKHSVMTTALRSVYIIYSKTYWLRTEQVTGILGKVNGVATFGALHTASSVKPWVYFHQRFLIYFYFSEFNQVWGDTKDTMKKLRKMPLLLWILLCSSWNSLIRH